MRPIALLIIASPLIAACAVGQTETASSGAVEPTTETPIAAETRAQQFCYFLESETLTSGVRLTLGAGSRVVGDTYGTIHNEQAPYFAFYRQTHDGLLSGETMTVTTVTEIEYDVQTDREIWIFSPERLVRDDLTYPAADCAVIEARFEADSGG